MFKHNLKAKYEPNGGRYLQIMSGKDLYDQTIVVSNKENDTFNRTDAFLMSFLNTFIDYPLGKMRTTDTKWKHWNTTPLRLWQTQLNFAVFWPLSACGVSSEHSNYKKHPMVRLLYQFYMYYHLRRVLKGRQVPLHYESRFNATDNSYSGDGVIQVVRGLWSSSRPHDVPKREALWDDPPARRLVGLHRPQLYDALDH